MDVKHNSIETIKHNRNISYHYSYIYTQSTLTTQSCDEGKQFFDDPLAEIKQRLQAADLQAVGTKCTLSTRLYQNLHTLPLPAELQPGAMEELSDQSEGATTVTNTGDSDAVDLDQPAASGTAVGHDTPSGQFQRRWRGPISPQALSARDMRAVKDLLRPTLGGGHPPHAPPTPRAPACWLPALQLARAPPTHSAREPEAIRGDAVTAALTIRSKATSPDLGPRSR